LGDSAAEVRSAFFLSDSEAWVLVTPAADRKDRDERGTPLRTLDGGTTWLMMSFPSGDWYLNALSAAGESVWLGGQRAVSARVAPKSVECDQNLISIGQLWSPVLYFKDASASGWEAQWETGTDGDLSD
jgi:hypothetical protein